MKIVLDTNLVFSAILKPNSLISELLHKHEFQFYAPEFLKEEINKHKEKIIQLAAYTFQEFENQKHHVYRRIMFLNEFQIQTKNYKTAKALVSDIDRMDILFVALAEELNCHLWTSDLKLVHGLRQKKYKNVITTDELKQLIK